MKIGICNDICPIKKLNAIMTMMHTMMKIDINNIILIVIGFNWLI